MVELKVDTAIINFVNNSNKTLYIWTQLEECFKCPFILWSNIVPNNNESNSKELTVDTNHGLKYTITEVSDSYFHRWCETTKNLKDQSRHTVEINLNSSLSHNSSDKYSCIFSTQAEGRNNIWPLIVAAIIYISFAIVFYVGRRIYYRWRERNSANVVLTPDSSIDAVAEEKKRKRLKSLDCFRGITILMMIFVNYGAGEYAYLDHAAWDGFNFADIIFPWFIFIMGTTMAISYKSIVIRQKMPVWKIFYKIIKRSVNLFLIGVILNSKGNPNFKTLRIPGVLQRFGISYLVVASSHVLSLLIHKGELFGALRIHQLIDIIPYWPEWIVMTIMGAIYFGLTYGWNYDPNCPIGYVGPGGLYDNASHPFCTGGAANYIDRTVFGKDHIYRWFTAAHLYDPQKNFKVSHDPEGILGCTTSIIMTFLGLQVGKILIAYPNPRQRITRWIVWGLVLGGLTALLTTTDWMPLNKNLWSFSFVLLTSSAACFAISLLYYLIDVIRIWPNGQPFHYPGMNSILLYIGHGICANMIPWTFNVDETSHVGLLARNLVGVTIWFIVSVVLAHKGFFLTV